MKRLFYLIVIIGLPILLFFQYQKWSKFSPPSPYDYELSDKIDINYFDQEVVKTYYQNAQEIGSYARATWYTDGIDVRFYDQQNTFGASKVAYYNALVAQTRQLEKQLELSQTYKAAGYNNQEVEQMLKTGVKPEELEQEKLIEAHLNLQFGDFSQEVYNLQKLLNAKGYSTPVDGNFRNSTQEMLQNFQTANDLAPTGIANRATLEMLLK